MKTLNDILHQSKYKDCNVKIGSKGGSSFYYCGKANPLYSIPLLKNIWKNLLEQNIKAKENLEKRLANLDNIYIERFNLSKKYARNLTDLQKKLDKDKKYEQVIIPKKIASIQYDIDTPILKRPIKEISLGISPDEKPCWIIYVKGNEKGNYWTIKEYNCKRKNYEFGKI